MKRAIFLCSVFYGFVFAQTDKFTPKDPTKWASPDDLFIGADFVHVTNEDVVVTLHADNAMFTGNLYFVPPEYPDSLHFLFSNKDAPGTKVNLSKLFDIPVGVVVTFMYQLQFEGNYTDRLPKYTGPNNDPSSPYYSRANGKYGHRFSVAGRVDENTVEFGFEDVATNSDWDFDDIIFQVDGLSLNVEVNPPVAEPSGREFLRSLEVTLATTTPDASIHYTLDGSTPTPKSPRYTGPINLINTTTLKAIAVLGNISSSVTTERYTLGIVQPPQISPPGGEFFGSITVSMTTATPGASIYYTTDGTTPTLGSRPYTGPITLTSATTLNAIAVLGEGKSEVATEQYTLGVVQPPQIHPPGGEFFGSITVGMTTATPGASIYYTTDGTTPTSGSAPYTGLLTLTSTTTLKAIAVFGGGESQVTTGQYTLAIVQPPQMDPPGAEFRGSISVSMTTATPGATIYYTGDGSTPTLGSRLYTGPITLTSSATLKAIAVLGAGVSEVATGQFTLKKINAVKAWIVDENRDGRADKVFVEFEAALSALPASITNIRWPDNAGEVRNAPANPATPEINPLGFAEGSGNTIVTADLMGEPFAFGVTEASTLNPPTLTLPEGSTVVIADSVGPVVVKAEKLPSDYRRYAITNGKDTLYNLFYPDTLKITLSEKIFPSPFYGGNPWLGLFSFIPAGDTSGPASVNFVGEPVIVSADSLTWQILVSPAGGSAIVSTGDGLFLNPSAPYFDALGNRPSEAPTTIGGRDGIAVKFEALLRVPIAGDAQFKGDIILPERISLFDEKYMYLGSLDEVRIEQWIPPMGLTTEGSVSDVTHNCIPLAQQQITDFPGSNCLLSMVISTEKSDGPFTASVTIFDHLGKFIHHSTQKFGYCGELEDENRRINGRVVNDIIWNQKDSRGNYVGSGVYLWKVRLHFQNGRSRHFMKKQGIARSAEPLKGCVSGL